MLSKKSFSFEFSSVKIPDTTLHTTSSCPILINMLNKQKVKFEYFTELGFSLNKYQKGELDMELIRKLHNLRILSCSMELNSEECFVDSRLLLCNQPTDESVCFILQRKSKIREVISFFILFQLVGSLHLQDFMIQCFRYFWRTHLTPYVLLHEIEQQLKEEKKVLRCETKLLKELPNCFSILLSVSSIYRKLFPELSNGYIRPRPLMDYCRYTIRNELKKFPNGMVNIDKLDLPPELKSYLWLRY
ncbi:hypothetical protein NPIL_284441 [Nephila pilipes]|uniref:SOCS box domain-containing protein n=1 Tax=Nephila pilipes TaxID=299642 RepID=A0A8X6Q261_NEPPI|nr:hypothetical protein NPIL_284441 [Nephila pilipes]